MAENHHHVPRGNEAPDEDVILTKAELKAFRESLPIMYHRFLPEIRRLRPEQFAVDDPVRQILEEFLAGRQHDDEGKD